MSDLIHILIEIPAGSSIKYEQDESNGRIYVDRFVPHPNGLPRKLWRH